jgi:hypothetical protein
MLFFSVYIHVGVLKHLISVTSFLIYQCQCLPTIFYYLLTQYFVYFEMCTPDIELCVVINVFTFDKISWVAQSV